MFKKILLATTIASLTTGAAIAGTMGPAYTGYQYLTGPYIGASIGSLINTLPAPAAYKGAQGILSAGWGTLLGHNVYVAGEIFGGSNASLKNMPRNNLSTQSVSSSWNYGIDFVPGVVFNERVLGYLRAGVMRTEFNDVNQQRTGWRLGVGGQTKLYKNVDVRLEYIFAEFQGLGTLNTLGRPLSDQANLGIVYKFA